MRGVVIKPEVGGGLEAARNHAGAGALRGVSSGVRVGDVARELWEVTRAGAVVVACACSRSESMLTAVAARGR